jgi:hypothetical protein
MCPSLLTTSRCSSRRALLIRPAGVLPWVHRRGARRGWRLSRLRDNREVAARCARNPTEGRHRGERSRDPWLANRGLGHRRHLWWRRLRSQEPRTVCPADRWYPPKRHLGSHWLGNQCPWDGVRDNRDPDNYGETECCGPVLRWWCPAGWSHSTLWSAQRTEVACLTSVRGWSRACHWWAQTVATPHPRALSPSRLVGPSGSVRGPGGGR